MPGIEHARSEHAFGRSRPFLVGIEEELLLVDRDQHALAPAAAAVLEAMPADGDRAGHEAYSAEIELRSSPAGCAQDAVAELQMLRADARASGVELIGAGIHPNAAWGEAELVDSERYRDVRRTMRGLIERTPECALHVHVAMPDPQSAIRAYNGLRVHLPVLIGLAANSPWWFGEDSGLASARHALVQSYPRRGVPPALRDFDHYAEVVDAVTAAGDLDDYTFLWWDVRPHPRLGTVEIREMDAQSRLTDVAALAALIQGLACHEAQITHPAAIPAAAIAEACFRAARDGLDAVVALGGQRQTLAEAARGALGLARPHARELGSDGALEGIEAIIAEGNGALRQREAHSAGGMTAMLGQLVAETARPAGAGV